MYVTKLELLLKKDLTWKTSYEKIAIFLRLFINKNDKDLKKEHYESRFSYYSFSNLFPMESDHVFKKGNTYTLEVRSLHKEFMDLKKFKGLENDEFELKHVNTGKLYYGGTGKIKTETPIFLKTSYIKEKKEMDVAKEKIRENILFRYVKSGLNTEGNLDELRKTVIKNIEIDRKVVSIPFEKKKLKNGKPYIYHCLHVGIEFQDNPIAKEVEKVVYAGGLGKNTSNGFGFMCEG